VTPVHYGGIERIVDMLARGLVAHGHEVAVFAHGDSRTGGRLVPWPGRQFLQCDHLSAPCDREAL
jgi:hypothetical protein